MKSYKMKICIILGTRPEIIKMAPVINECRKRHLNFFILHTNQHYSENLDKIFFKELRLPFPKYNLGVGSGTHGKELGRMLIGIEKVLLKEKPDIVLVEGDTNTVLAGALAASKLQIKVGHIEAGLRSYSREMPEEINRILTDHCSDFLFAPTKKAKEILIGEGIFENKIFMTGNTIVDAVYQNLKLSVKKSKILNKLELQKNEYFLITIHRSENVDREKKIKGIIEGLKLVGQKFKLPLVFPIHPRTQKMFKKIKIKSCKEIKLIKPIGYFDFMQLLSGAVAVFTDSGGIQEEACILKIPCITLRDNTERPETIKIGSNILAGTNPKKILDCAEKMINLKNNWKNCFGDGKSGETIIKIILK